MAGQLLRRALTVALVVLGAGAVFSCTSTNKMQDEDKARDFALSPVIAGPASLLVPRSAQAAGKAQAQVPHGTVCNLKGRLGGSQAGLKVHILGDSHMASDDFSERLRELIGATNAPGALYPALPKYHRLMGFKFINHDFTVVNSLTGGENFTEGGVKAVANSQKATLEITSTAVPQPFDIGIYFKAPKEGLAFSLSDGSGQSFNVAAPVAQRWLYLRRPGLTLPVKLSASQAQLEIGGYNLLRAGDVSRLVDTMGINGAQSDLWRRWDRAQMMFQYRMMKYDLVILAYGANDGVRRDFDAAEYKRNLRELATLIWQANAQTAIVLLAPPPVASVRGGTVQYYPNAEKMRRAQREIAEQLGVFQLDFDEVVKNEGGKASWLERELSQRDLHLTARGYSRLAEIFYKKLVSQVQACK